MKNRSRKDVFVLLHQLLSNLLCCCIRLINTKGITWFFVCIKTIQQTSKRTRIKTGTDTDTDTDTDGHRHRHMHISYDMTRLSHSSFHKMAYHGPFCPFLSFRQVFFQSKGWNKWKNISKYRRRAEKGIKILTTHNRKKRNFFSLSYLLPIFVTHGNL